MKNALKPDQFRLYQIIWERFVACQMTPSAVGFHRRAHHRRHRCKRKPCTFKATGRTLVFDGYLKRHRHPARDRQSPCSRNVDREAAAVPILHRRAAEVHFAPGPLLSEASLIKMLESEGIGRPSTYASASSQTIQDRKYVEQIDRRHVRQRSGRGRHRQARRGLPQDHGSSATPATWKLELDKIEDDHLDWVTDAARSSTARSRARWKKPTTP